MTRITVVIPTFNRAEELRRALNSLCAQTNSDFFVIVADNCSTDGTEKVISCYKDQLRLTYLRSLENFGPIPNWEMGLRAVTTEWVKILWSDDWLEPNALAELMNFVDEQEIDVALCGAYGHLSSGIVRWVSEGFEEANWDEVVPKLIAGTLPVSATAGLIRTSVALEGLLTKILDPLAYSTAIGPDLLMLYWAVIKGGTAGYLDEPLVNMFASEDSISIVRGVQLRPLYAHTILIACQFANYNLKKNERKVLEHWVKEGVVLNRIPELIGTEGKFSLQIALSTWPMRLFKRLWRTSMKC